MNKRKPTSVTVTYHRSGNYGALLQTYALQQCLLNIGFDNQILDAPRNPNDTGFHFTGNLKLDLARIVLSIFSIIHIVSGTKLKKNFENFINSRLKLTKPYESSAELTANPPVADCYFTGSDQVFDVRGNDYQLNRNFLQFADKNKYSYAASLAAYDYNKEEQDFLNKNLQSFSNISLRENQGLEYLSSFIENSKMRVDVDPVFLLSKEEWLKIAEKPTEQSYILYFQINGNKLADSVLKELKKQTGKKIICVQTSPFIQVHADKAILDASPEQFLGWIAYADYVVTTSFHGTALSIILEKQFYSLIKESANPKRIINLLEAFSLQDRLVTSETILSCEKKYSERETTALINKMKSDSIEYLKKIYCEMK